MHKRCTTIAALLFMASATSISAQTADNMVYNPSFEEYKDCPKRIDALGVMKDVEAWWQPTGGSSDYFNICGGRECLVPRNKMGIQEAHSGNAYCGIYCSQELYREYLQTELKTPLEAGKHYCVSFYISLADKSPHAAATLGALFTSTAVGDSLKGILMDREVTDIGQQENQSIAVFFEPQVVNNYNVVLNDTKGWTRISGEFIAKGGERFMTIGNFHSFNKSNVIDLQNPLAVLPGAYYYIDDVSVTCSDTLSYTAPARPEPAEGAVIQMWGVYFETNTSELLQQSYHELHQLIDLLNSHPAMHIELIGHTDNTGTIDFNQHLSEDRARAVVEYLVAHGIDRKRLTSTGFGKSRPIDTNDTPEGRQHNRRVEYRVVHQ